MELGVPRAGAFATSTPYPPHVWYYVSGFQAAGSVDPLHLVKLASDVGTHVRQRIPRLMAATGAWQPAAWVNHP